MRFVFLSSHLPGSVLTRFLSVYYISWADSLSICIVYHPRIRGAGATSQAQLPVDPQVTDANLGRSTGPHSAVVQWHRSPSIDIRGTLFRTLDVHARCSVRSLSSNSRFAFVPQGSSRRHYSSFMRSLFSACQYVAPSSYSPSSPQKASAYWQLLLVGISWLTPAAPPSRCTSPYPSPHPPTPPIQRFSSSSRNGQARALCCGHVPPRTSGHGGTRFNGRKGGRWAPLCGARRSDRGNISTMRQMRSFPDLRRRQTEGAPGSGQRRRFLVRCISKRTLCRPSRLGAIIGRYVTLSNRVLFSRIHLVNFLTDTMMVACSISSTSCPSMQRASHQLCPSRRPLWHPSRSK